MAYQLVVDGKAYDVPDDATWLTDRDSRVITATWLRTFFWNTLQGEPFGRPEFQTTVVGNGQPHIICTVPVTYHDRTAYGVGEAWPLNLKGDIMKQYPALQARRRAESDAILAVLNIADRVYTDDQIPRSEARTEPNGLQPKPTDRPASASPPESRASAPDTPAPETPSTPETPAAAPKGAQRTSQAGGKPAGQPPAEPAEPANSDAPPNAETAASATTPVDGDPHDVVITVGNKRSQFYGKTLRALLESRNQQALRYIRYLATYAAKTPEEKTLVAAAEALLPEVEQLVVPATGQGRSA